MNEADGIAPGTVLLGKYRIESTIGRGGMGLVYRAHHLQLDELVAIKVLRSDVLVDEEAVMRFEREAQAAVKLKSEHVARIQDVGTFEDGAPFMVMEYLAGADLGTMVDDHGAMHVEGAVDLMLQACDALAEAHSLGIVHRDVKPSNLFLTTRPDGAFLLKILDFGISKSVTGADLSLTQTQSVLGTPAYMSPEQMRSARHVDARTDIWSLGTVLYELVEGRRPFLAETFSEMCVMAAVDPYEPMVRAPQLDPIVARCMAKQPDDRYPTIAELAADLAPWASDPHRAESYVARTHRVLERAYDPSRPVVPHRPTPFPGGPPPLAVPGVTLSTMVVPSRTARWAPWIAMLVVGVGIAAAAAIALSGNTAISEPGESAEPTVRMQAIQAAPPSIPAVPATGSATGSPGEASGSGSATPTAEPASAEAGSGDAGSGSAVTTRAGAGELEKGSRAKKGGGKKRGGAARGGSAELDSGRGDGPATGDGAGSGSAAKKCDPFVSPRGC